MRESNLLGPRAMAPGWGATQRDSFSERLRVTRSLLLSRSAQTRFVRFVYNRHGTTVPPARKATIIIFISFSSVNAPQSECLM